MDSLTDEQRTILDLEGRFWATAGAKEAAIRDGLGMSPARYYQRLNRLLGLEAALVYDAVTVNRLRRVRVDRRR